MIGVLEDMKCAGLMALKGQLKPYRVPDIGIGYAV
jgi:hypothetical protein